MPHDTPPSLLTLPTELRNAIYLHVFTPSIPIDVPPYRERPDPLAIALQLQHDDATPSYPARSIPNDLRFLQTCDQIHAEAHLLALSLTTFHVQSEYTYPACFAQLCAPLRATKLGAIRHLTLTAKIQHLRALNEAWAGLPFGNTNLHLDTLTIVPRRPDVTQSAYAEVADLSQSHTLAYIFAETLKRLRNVRCVLVLNRGCFKEVVWRLVYRSLVYRIWRWGGERAGVRFECGEEGQEGWFRVWLGDGNGRDCGGREVGEEVVRLVGGGGSMPDPNLVGF